MKDRSHVFPLFGGKSISVLLKQCLALVKLQEIHLLV